MNTNTNTSIKDLDTQILDLRNARDFNRLHSETHGLLLYVASQLGMQRDEREDVVQQAFLRLLESGKEFTFSHAKAYLICSVRTITIDSKRRATSRKTQVFDDWSGLEGRQMWESDNKHDAAVNALTAVLDRLGGDPSTTLLSWFYRDGLSVKEIKEKTGEATGTITAKLCRLRRKFAPLLISEIESAVALRA